MEQSDRSRGSQFIADPLGLQWLGLQHDHASLKKHLQDILGTLDQTRHSYSVGSKTFSFNCDFHHIKG